MDLVGHDRETFDAICAAFAGAEGTFTAIPLSAATGANVTRRSDEMSWYSGPSLLDLLESVPPAEEAIEDAPFRMPVQWVIRGNGKRSFAGMVASGHVAAGDELRVMPAGTPAKVDRVMIGDESQYFGMAGQSVALSFRTEVDCSRGDVLAAADAPPEVADQFEAVIVWMGDEDLVAGRQYGLKLATQYALATVQPPKHEIDVDTMEHVAARTLAKNGIGVADLWTDRPLVFAPYKESRELGGFILIDRVTNDTIGAGLIRHALRRSQNVHAQALDVTREARAAMKGQKPVLLWFTGLSGAGKSTIANLVEKKLHASGRHTFLLDGDNVRLGLNRDLGFSEADRAENVRRVGETAKLMLDSGLIVLAAFISPYRSERDMVRQMLPEGEFVEIFVDAPLAEAEKRDPKGLYRKARAGEIPNFTGIGSPYEAPERPEIRIDTTRLSAEQAADEILAWLH
jgi:bifunctional enzyme CysN/CysC